MTLKLKLVNRKILMRKHHRFMFSKTALSVFQKELYWKSWKAFFPKCCGQIIIDYYFLNHKYFGFGLTCRFSCKIFLSKKDPLAKIAKRNAKRILRKLAIKKHKENKKTLKSFLKYNHLGVVYLFYIMKWK